MENFIWFNVGLVVGVLIALIYVHFRETRYKWVCEVCKSRARSRYKNNVEFVAALHYDQFPDHESQ